MKRRIAKKILKAPSDRGPRHNFQQELVAHVRMRKSDRLSKAGTAPATVIQVQPIDPDRIIVMSEKPSHVDGNGVIHMTAVPTGTISRTSIGVKPVLEMPKTKADLEVLTIAQLREIAKALPSAPVFGSAAKKAEIVALLAPCLETAV